MNNHTQSIPTPHSVSPSLRLFVSLLALLLSPLSLAQDLTHKAPPQSQPILITGATIHTASGDTLENAALAFEQGRITYLGSTDRAPRPRANTRVIDARGMHIAPGFFAPETQLGLVEIGAVRATRDFNETGGVTPEVKAITAVNPDSTLIPVARSGGVLLAGVFPTGGRVPGQVSVIRLEGWTNEDMQVNAGTPMKTAGLAMNWPSMRPNNAWWNDTPAAEQQKRIDEAVRQINDLWDDAEAYQAARESNSEHPVDLRLEAMRPVVNAQAPLLITANDYDQIVAAATWTAGRGYRMILVGGRDAPLAADLLNSHDIPVILDGTHTFPKRADQPHDHAYTLPKRLHDAGVKFALGTADRDGNVRNLPFEAGMAARFGLDRAEALRSITLRPAEIMGVAGDYGSLETGKSATLIITTADPLEVRTHVLHAFIDGRDIDLTNKQTALADKYREKYRQLGLIQD